MNRFVLATGAVLVSSSATACDLPVACPLDVRYAIEIAVRDSVTGAPAARGTRGVIQAGSRSDSLRVLDDVAPEPLWLGAGQRGGTYAVRLERAGYKPWTRRDVEVDAGACGPHPVELEARLQPAP